GNLVQDAPCCEHRHHGRFARASGHLATQAPEGGEAFNLALLARLIEWDGYALQIIRAGFVQENDGLRRLKLREEKLMLPPLPPPIGDQLVRRAREAGSPFCLPFGYSVTNEI